MKIPQTADFVNMSSISVGTAILCFLAGIVLGYAYFYSLWKTVEYFCNHDKRKIILFWSFLIRMLLLLTGFILIADKNFIRLAICLGGFYITRYVFIGHEALKRNEPRTACSKNEKVFGKKLPEPELISVEEKTAEEKRTNRLSSVEPNNEDKTADKKEIILSEDTLPRGYEKKENLSGENLLKQDGEKTDG